MHLGTNDAHCALTKDDIMDFRRSTPHDISLIEAAEADIFPDPWSRESISSVICDRFSMCFTAIKDGELVGYILGRLIAPEGEIYRIAIMPKYRRRGIGYRLLDYARKTERGRGLECLFLEVRSENTPAISLYKAYGFSEIGRRRGYYKNPDDDAIIMLRQ